MLCLALSALSAASARAATIDIAPDSLSAPGVRSATFVLLPLNALYRLPDAFLAAGGDSAWMGAHALVAGVDYALDRAPGTIRLLSPFEPGDTLHVRYRVLPVHLPALVGMRAAWSAPDTGAASPGDFLASSTPGAAVAAAAAPTSAKPEASGEPGPEVHFAGNKSVSVQFGSQHDAALRQALDVTTSGKLGGGTEFTAVLSDQNSSLSESGGTLDLAELDRVLVEVRNPHASGTLGDFSFLHQGGSFAALTRELTGVRAMAHGGGFSGQTTVALEKGQFRSIEIRGEEGKQGPYLLPDVSGATGRPVVPSSERVWLDGERLSRGEAADYSMDYDRGRLTFTSRRPITSASRIAVDYEVANTAYRRSALAMTAAAQHGAWQLFGHSFRESDDAGRPLLGNLSESDRLLLSQAGNDPTRAVAPGGVAGVGDYNLVADSSGAQHYAYAGRAAGAYQVEFVSRGLGQGAYADSLLADGTTAYRYVGPTQGSFVAGRQLSLPSENRILGGGASYHPVSWLTVGGEVAASTADPNLLSPVGDRSTQGTAGKASFSATPTLHFGGADRGRLEANVDWNRRDTRFLAPARQDSAFFQEDWGSDENDPLTGREVAIGSLRYLVGGLAVGGEAGHLNAEDGFSARRLRGTASWNGALMQELRIDRVDSRDAVPDSVAGAPADGYRDKIVYQAAWTRTPLVRPSFSFDREERVIPGRADSSNMSYRTWTAGLSGARRVWSWSGGYSERHDDSPNVSLPRLARDLRFAVNAAPGAGWSGGLGASRRWTEGAAGPGRVDNGYARLHQQTPGRMWSQEASADWTSEFAYQRRRSIVRVGAGAGAYDSLGNFVGKGDFDVQNSENTGTAVPLARAGFSYRADLRPWGGSGDLQGWKALHVSGLIQSSAGRRGELRLTDFLAMPSRTASDTSYAQGSWLGRVEVEKPSGTVEMYARLERDGTTDRALATVSSMVASWIGEGRLRWHANSSWLVEGTTHGARRDGVQQAPGIVVSRELRESGVSLEGTRFVRENVRLGVITSWDLAAAPGSEPLSSLRAGPHVFYAVGNRMRLEGLARWGRVRGDTVPVLFPSGFATQPDRFDFNTTASYRIRERANLDFTWSGHAPVGQGVIHNAVASLRTYF
ncbi:MAG TPA: hypothetical protein VGR66_12835 [Candidatus Eisenbacteria bacterium]|nr:hypothetical protein [Candidatus Eisenbacteria bacterium]